jgi:hypothetical protein
MWDAGGYLKPFNFFASNLVIVENLL